MEVYSSVTPNPKVFPVPGQGPFVCAFSNSKSFSIAPFVI